MTDDGVVVVVGSTAGIGLEIARHYVDRGREVILTGREEARAQAAARGLGGRARGVALDLLLPESIAAALAPIERVDGLVLSAIHRDDNRIAAFDVARALGLVTLKLVGYAEVVHTLVPCFHDGSAIVLFGGMAKERPYPGSTTVSTVNGGIVGLARSLVIELAPIRVNTLHPGIVGDSPYWSGREASLEATRQRTPTGRLPSMQDIVAATAFLLENPAANGIDLIVDGGWHCT